MKKIKHLIMSLLYYLPNKVAHKILYKKRIGKKLNLSNPVDYNEKIHYLIINEYTKSLYSDLVDKYKVRFWIEQKGYKNLLPQLYGVYENTEEIDYKKLPNAFVLKPNNGCGNVWICTDKNKFDFIKCKKELDKSLKSNFAKTALEYQYANIKPKIICEEYLNDKTNLMPNDYKFYCFDGKVDCILVCSNRQEKLKLMYYDTKWNKLNYVLKKYEPSHEIQKPKCLNEMIEICENLSKEFCFVRIDLYEIAGKVYFGEMTFSPAAGNVYYNTQEALNYFGNKINLEKLK